MLRNFSTFFCLFISELFFALTRSWLLSRERIGYEGSSRGKLTSQIRTRQRRAVIFQVVQIPRMLQQCPRGNSFHAETQSEFEELRFKFAVSCWLATQ